MEGHALDPLEGALDAGAMEAEALGNLGERRLGCFAPGLGHDSHDIRLFCQPSVPFKLVDGGELAAGRSHRSLEVCRFGVQDTIELPAQRPRDLTGFQLEKRRPGSDAAEEEADCLGALPGHDATSPTEPPRRRQPSAGYTLREQRCSAWLDHELEVGPPARDAQRSMGEEQAPEIGHPAMFGGPNPVERADRRRRAATGQAELQAREDGIARASITRAARLAQPSQLRSEVTGA